MPLDKNGRWYPANNGRSNYTPTPKQTPEDKDKERKRKTAALALTALDAASHGLLKILPKQAPPSPPETDNIVSYPREHSMPGSNWAKPAPKPREQFGPLAKPVPTPKELAQKMLHGTETAEASKPLPDMFAGMASVVDDQVETQQRFGKGRDNKGIPAPEGALTYGELLKSGNKNIHDALLKGDTAALTRAIAEDTGLRSKVMDMYHDVPTIGPREIPFTEKVADTAKGVASGAKTFGANTMQGVVDSVPGARALHKAVTGHDANEMAQEYLNYIDNEHDPSLGDPMSPQDYFRFQDHPKLVSDAEATDILRRAGINQGGAAGAGYFTGNVIGMVGSLGGGAAAVGKGTTQLVTKALQTAPKWLSKGLSSVVGAAATGATYQTQMEIGQELEQPDEQNFMGHLKDVGETSLYFGAYGAASPIAEKFMQKVGSILPDAVKNASSKVANKLPSVAHVAKSVTEGGLTGGIVGTGMGAYTFATTGDPNKALGAFTGESRSEMAENFVESIAYSIMRRGGFPVHGADFGINENHDPIDSVVQQVVNNMPDEMKDDYNEAMKDAEAAGLTPEEAHNIMLDALSQTEEGSQLIQNAIQAVSDSHTENQVATNGVPTPQPEAVQQPTPEAVQPTVQPTPAPTPTPAPVQPQVIDNKPEAPSQPQAQQPKMKPVTDPQAGMEVGIAGKGDQRFTVVSVDNKGMVTLRSPQGGELTVHKGNLFATDTPQAPAPKQADAGDQTIVNKPVPDVQPGQRVRVRNRDGELVESEFLVTGVDGDKVTVDFGGPQGGGHVTTIDKSRIEEVHGEGTTAPKAGHVYSYKDMVTKAGTPRIVVQHPTEPDTTYIFEHTGTTAGMPKKRVKGETMPHTMTLDDVKSELGLEMGVTISLDDLKNFLDGKPYKKYEKPPVNEVNRTKGQVQVEMNKFMSDRNRDNWNPTHTYNGLPVEVQDFPEIGVRAFRYKEMQKNLPSDKWGADIKLDDAEALSQLVPIEQGDAESAAALVAEAEPETDEMPPQTTKAGNPATDNEVTPVQTSGLDQFTITETKHTKTGETLFVVKPKERWEDFTALKSRMSKIGGVYSRYTHGFNFKSDPTERVTKEFGGTAPAQPAAEAPTDIKVERFRNSATVSHLKLPGIRVSISALMNKDKKGKYSASYNDNGTELVIKREFGSIEEGIQWATETLQKDYASQNSATAPEQTKTDKPKGNPVSDVLKTLTRKVWIGGEKLEQPDPVAADVVKLMGSHEKAINDFVISQGSGQVKPLGAGSGSVVLDIGKDLVARIGIGQFADIPVSPLVNQPHAQKMFGHIRVEIFDKLETSDITQDDEEYMMEKLEEEGLVFFDPGTDNLGRNKRGDLLVLDPGAVKRQDDPIFDIPMKERHGPEWERLSAVGEALSREDIDKLIAEQESTKTETEITVPGLKNPVRVIHFTNEADYEKYFDDHAVVNKEMGSMSSGAYLGGNVVISPKASGEKVDGIIGHEIGHIVYNEFLLAFDQIEDRHAEWEKASRKRRTNEWTHADNEGTYRASAISGWKKYLSRPDEMFADAFSMYWNDKAQAEKVMPNTAAFLDEWLSEDGRTRIEQLAQQSYDNAASIFNKAPQEKKPTGDNIIDSYAKAVKQTQKLINSDVTLKHLFENNQGQNAELVYQAWERTAKAHALDVANILSGWNEAEHVKFLKELLDGELLVNLYENQFKKDEVKTGGQTDGVGSDGAETLGGTPTEDVSSTESVGETGTSTVRGPRTNEGRDGGSDKPQGDGPSDGMGSSTPNVDSPAGRGNDAGTGNRPDGVGSERPNVTTVTPRGTNHVITDDSEIGFRTAKQSFRRNVDAIRLMKQIMAEGRAATADEQKILAQYVGWGGIKQPFEPDLKLSEDWKAEKAELKELLTPEEFKHADDSAANAHFTSPEVIKALYDGLKGLGFDGGRILEPSMGVGNFFGLMPRDLANASRITGVEKDSITGNIAKLLYPASDVRVMGFEDAKMADNFYDVAVGNVPFANTGIADAHYKGTPLYGASIHNYFFGKAMDKVRPGGIVMFITSRYSLDSQDGKFRRFIASKADMIGAIRLPQTAFKEVANTEVVTDILIFQKRPENTPAKEGTTDWVDTGYTRLENGKGFTVNQYFIDNPQMVMGKLSSTGSMYGASELTVLPNPGEDLGEVIRKVFDSLPKDIIPKREKKATEDAKPHEIIAAPGHVKENAYVVHSDGNLYVKKDDQLIPVDVPKATADRIKGMIGIRNAVREYLGLQLNDKSTETQIAASRTRLNKVYDDFVKKNSFLNKPVNVRAFVDDPDSYLLLSLEKWDKDLQTAEKADIFSQRTIAHYKPAEKADTAKEALVISLNELGRVDLEHIAKLTGKSVVEIISDPELEGRIYDDPQKGWVTSDEYLSGNVKAKLIEAQNAAELDPVYQKNVTALEAVQPTPLMPEEIEVKLGAHWLPASYLNDFLSHLSGYPSGHFQVGYNRQATEWVVDFPDEKMKKRIRQSTDVSVKWGTNKYDAVDFVEMGLNLKDPKVTFTVKRADGSTKTKTDKKATMAAKEKMKAIQKEFAKWLWSDETRAAEIAQMYNDKFNTERLREFDGEHLTFPGMSPVWQTRFKQHQKAAVWRAIQNGNTLFAHAVGAGKTVEMIASMMEMKRLGLVNKPMWVVPNHLVAQSGAAFLDTYPAANILVAGKKDFETKNRKKLFAKIATGNYDAVIVAHSSFGHVGMSEDVVREFFEEQIRQLDEAIEMDAMSGRRSKTRLGSRMRSARGKLITKMNKQLQKLNKDDLLSFEELGVDGIVVDEAHEFKNLMYSTKLENVAGLGTPEGSGKAFDLFMKVQYLQKLNGGRGVIFATGTPVSNSMVEMYTMQRYLQYDELERRGILNFDAWVSQFGNVKSVTELKPEGKGLRQRQRLSEIFNLPELLHMFRAFADVKTADELLAKGLITRPDLIEGKRQAVEVPPSEELLEFVAGLAERAEAIRSGKVKADEDNMLAIVDAGRKAALDMRLVDPTYPNDDPNSKASTAARKVSEIYKKTKKYKTKSGKTIENGTQLVFLDLSTPKGEKQNADGDSVADDSVDDLMSSVYEDLRKKMIKNGVDPKHIAFIHDYKKDEHKEELFRKMNTGEIRILIGSTAKMGAGMNVQRKLTDLHHIDVPYRPMDVEQREGRILRQGNENDEVAIHAYITTGSFDAYMWQLIAAKAKIVDQVLSGDLKSRRVQDPSGMELSANEIKARATGDDRFVELADLEVEVATLDNVRADLMEQLRYLRSDYQQRVPRYNHLKEIIPKYETDLSKREDTTGDKFTIKIGDETIADRKTAGEKLNAIGKELSAQRAEVNQKVGEFAGFTLMVETRFAFVKDGAVDVTFYLMGNARYNFTAQDTADGTARSMEYTVSRIENRINDMKSELADQQVQINKFTNEEKRIIEENNNVTAEYNVKNARKEQLEIELSVDRNADSEDDLDDSRDEDGDVVDSNVDDEEDSDDEDHPRRLAAPASSGSTQPRRRPVRKSVLQSIARLIEPSKLVLTPKTTEKLADMLTEHLGTIMEKGHVGARALGQYDYKHNIGRVRSEHFGNWRVIGHEIGHAYDNLMELIGDDVELRAMYHALYPRPSKSAPVKLQIQEGFAEFFQQWVVDPALARKNAPKTSDLFEKHILSNKELKPLFTKIRTIVDADLQGDALGRAVSGVIVPQVEDDGETMGANYAVGPLRRAVFEAVDSLIPAKDMAKAAKETGYKDADYLVKLMSISGDAQTKGLAAFEAPMRDQDGRFLSGKSLKDQYQDIVDKIGKAVGWEEVKLSTVDREIKVLNKTIYKQYKKMGAREIAGAIMVARRVQERRSEGFTTLPMTEEMAKEIMDIANARFPEAVKAAEEFTRSFSGVMLDKLERADILDAATRKRIEDGSDFYIPFIYDEKRATKISGRKTGGQTYSKVAKKFVGKFLPVVDPLQAVLMKLTQVEQALEYKRVINEIMRLAQHKGMGPFASIIPVSKVATKIDMGSVLQSIMKTVGISDQTDFGQEMTMLSEVLEGHPMTIFSQDAFKTITGEPVILNFVNGKPVPIQLAPDVFKMIMAMKPIQMNAAMKGLAYMSRGFRWTALATPTYVKNAVSRDFFTGIIQSKNSVGAMAKHTATSMGVMMGAYLNHTGKKWLGSDTELAEYMEAQYQLFVSSGGASAAAENMLRGMLGKLYDVDMIHTKAPGWAYAVGRGGKKVLVRTLGTPNDILRFIEEGPRIAEFMSTLKKEFKNRGHDAEEMYKLFVKEGTDALPYDLQLEMERILVEATYASGEITTNFRLHGANEGFRQYVPTVTFLHGTVQGTARLMRQARQKPWPTLGYGVVMIGGMSALAWALMMYDDDDRKWFQDLPSNMRDKYWWFPNPFAKGTYITVAKPFDYALPLNFAERFVDWKWGSQAQSREWNDDFASMFSTILGTDLYSNALKTVAQMWANKNDFGGDIVPMSEMQDLFPWRRYDEAKTSLTSRAVAEVYARLVGDENSFSPRKMDYFIENMLGRWGDTGLSLLDWAGMMGSKSLFQNKDGPEYNLVVGALVYGQAEGGSPRIIEKFYDDYNSTGHLIGTLQDLMEKDEDGDYTGAFKDPKLAKKYATEANLTKITSFAAMKNIAEFISSSNKEFDAIINDKETNAAIRSQMTLKKNYVRRLASGILYGQMPPSPHESIGITSTDVEALIADIVFEAEQAQLREERKDGGPSDVVEALVELLGTK